MRRERSGSLWMSLCGTLVWLCLGASAAHALGVSLLVILSRGGWASSSDTVRKYVDVSVQPDAAVFKFFASLLPPHAVEPACSRLLGL